MTPELPPDFAAERARKNAERFCEDVRRALKMAQELNGIDDYSDEERRWAAAAAESVIHESAFGGLPFRLRISLPEGAIAHVSKSWEIIDEHPSEFEATEVRVINPERAEFHDIGSDHWLVVFGHDIEVNPVLPE